MSAWPGVERGKGRVVEPTRSVLWMTGEARNRRWRGVAGRRRALDRRRSWTGGPGLEKACRLERAGHVQGSGGVSSRRGSSWFRYGVSFDSARQGLVRHVDGRRGGWSKGLAREGWARCRVVDRVALGRDEARCVQGCRRGRGSAGWRGPGLACLKGWLRWVRGGVVREARCGSRRLDWTCRQGTTRPGSDDGSACRRKSAGLSRGVLPCRGMSRGPAWVRGRLAWNSRRRRRGLC